MGSIRFVFAFGTNLLIQSATVGGVAMFGGGASGWRTMAIIYALLGLAVNTLSVFSVKELPPEELEEEPEEDKLSVGESAKILVSNKYYLIILIVFLLTQIFTAMLNMGIYFMKYVLGDADLLKTFAWSINVPLMIGLLITPLVVSRFGGMYRINIIGYVIATLGRLGVLVAAYMDSLALMLFFSGVAALGMSSLQGTLNALIAEASENTWLRTGKRIDGLMFSCTSLGVKVGGGLGAAISGWLLAAAGYDGNLKVQPESAIQMIYVMYVWLPLAANALILFLLMRLDVEKVNTRLKEEADARAEDEDRIAVNLNRLRRQLLPRDEWRQMFDENARLMRDHYWREDMNGIDWDAVCAGYRPLLERITTHDDLVDVLAEPLDRDVGHVRFPFRWCRTAGRSGYRPRRCRTCRRCRGAA